VTGATADAHIKAIYGVPKPNECHCEKYRHPLSCNGSWTGWRRIRTVVLYFICHSASDSFQNGERLGKSAYIGIVLPCQPACCLIRQIRYVKFKFVPRRRRPINPKFCTPDHSGERNSILVRAVTSFPTVNQLRSCTTVVQRLCLADDYACVAGRIARLLQGRGVLGPSTASTSMDRQICAKNVRH
jgi:hypothetical protein